MVEAYINDDMFGLQLKLQLQLVLLPVLCEHGSQRDHGTWVLLHHSYIKAVARLIYFP